MDLHRFQSQKRHFPGAVVRYCFPITLCAVLLLSDTGRSHKAASYTEERASNHAGTSCEAICNVCCTFFTLC